VLDTPTSFAGLAFEGIELMTHLPTQYTGAVTFSFGDSPKMADELLGHVMAGRKTATCGARRDFGPGKEALPEIGRRDIVLDGQGRPAAVIETIELTVRRFDQVDEQFAFDEGEGFRSLQHWRDGHRGYFERNGGWSEHMELFCERFRLIEVLARD
jgi:uncharacterized protein YhfF